MKKSAELVLVYVLLAFWFSGCASAPANTPTPTDRPAATHTVVPTEAPTATATAMPMFIPGADGSISMLVLQPDGKILVGGLFTTLNGEMRNHIARLNPDRTLDVAFNPGADGWADRWVSALALQPDGKIVVGGFFTTLGGGEPRNNIARLNPDGTLDAAFNPGADAAVSALAVQPDGKILVGGEFTAIGGQTRLLDHIARLNPDGTPDATFNLAANGVVYALAVQPDGKIVVGGYFTTLGGEPRKGIARLNPDGTLDTVFNPGTSYFDPGSVGAVSLLVLQPDGKIVVGGSFTTLGGEPRHSIARLNPDGTLDTAFNPDIGLALETGESVYALALQADGKILVGGDFAVIGRETPGIVRLNPDGTLDSTFNPGSYGVVVALVVQPDGKIVLGGGFTTLNGETRNNIAGLNPDGTLEEALSLP